MSGLGAASPRELNLPSLARLLEGLHLPSKQFRGAETLNHQKETGELGAPGKEQPEGARGGG